MKEKYYTDKINKVLLSVPIEIDNKFREMGKRQGISKSAVYLMAINYYLDFKDTMDALPSIVAGISKQVEQGQGNSLKDSAESENELDN